MPILFRCHSNGQCSDNKHCDHSELIPVLLKQFFSSFFWMSFMKVFPCEFLSVVFFVFLISPFFDLVPYQWFWYHTTGFWSMYGGWIIPDEQVFDIATVACFNLNYHRVQPVHRLSFQPLFFFIGASSQHPTLPSFFSPNVSSRSIEVWVLLPDWPHPIVVFLHLVVLEVLVPFDECYYRQYGWGLMLSPSFPLIGLLHAFLTTLLYLPWTSMTRSSPITQYLYWFPNSNTTTQFKDELNAV